MGIRTANGKLRLRNGKLAVMTPGRAVLAALNTGMIGQSNMVHLSDPGSNPAYYITGPLAHRWVNSTFERVGWYDSNGVVTPGTVYAVAASNPSAHLVCDPWSTGGTVKRGDGITLFVNNFNAATSVPLTTYEYAVVGSSIEQWQTGGVCWTPFHDAVVASGRALDSVILLLGEENASFGTTKAAYKTYLRSLHDQQLALSGKTAGSFYFGIVILGPGTTYAAEGNMGVIRAAQLEYIAENVGAYCAAVATDMDLAGDSIHFLNFQLVRMGARYAKSLATWQKGTQSIWPGPKIAGATRSGTTVTVTTSGGTGSLKDGAGGSGASVKGFRFFDAGAGGAQITYTASSLSGSSIVLTLASTPAGALTMDYGMANAPFGGTTALASVVYDSDTVPGDTTGLPLIPCSPITVN